MQNLGILTIIVRGLSNVWLGVDYRQAQAIERGRHLGEDCPMLLRVSENIPMVHRYSELST